MSVIAVWLSVVAFWVTFAVLSGFAPWAALTLFVTVALALGVRAFAQSR